MLEGQDRNGRYFTTLSVASPNRWQARALALRAAQRHGLHILGVEELDAAGPASGPARSRVLKAPWDRSYIPTDPD